MTEAKMRAHDVLDSKIEKECYIKECNHDLHLTPLEFIGGSAKWLTENFGGMCTSYEDMKIYFEIMGKSLVRFLLNDKEFADLIEEVRENDKCKDNIPGRDQ